MSDHVAMSKFKAFPWPDGKVVISIATSFRKAERDCLRRVMTRLTELLKVDTPQGPRYAIFFKEVPRKDLQTKQCRIGKTKVQFSQAFVGVPTWQPYSNMKLAMRKDMVMSEIMHEFCHVLGLFHEHCRPDRDRHVFIPQYLTHDSSPNYGKRKREEYVNPLIIQLEYDYDSLMHYSSLQAVIPHSVAATSPKQGQTLTKLDIQKLHVVYPPRYTLDEIKQQGAVLEESELCARPQPLQSPNHAEMMDAIRHHQERRLQLRNELQRIQQWPYPTLAEDLYKREHSYHSARELFLTRLAKNLETSEQPLDLSVSKPGVPTRRKRDCRDVPENSPPTKSRRER